MARLVTRVERMRPTREETVMYLALPKGGRNLQFRLPFFLEIGQGDRVIFHGDNFGFEKALNGSGALRITHSDYESVTFEHQDEDKAFMGIEAKGLYLLAYVEQNWR